MKNTGNVSMGTNENIPVGENIYWYSQFGKFKLQKKTNETKRHRDLGLGSKIYKEKKEND